MILRIVMNSEKRVETAISTRKYHALVILLRAFCSRVHPKEKRKKKKKMRTNNVAYILARSAESVLGPNYFACFLETGVRNTHRMYTGVVLSRDDRATIKSRRRDRRRTSLSALERGLLPLQHNARSPFYIYLLRLERQCIT